VVTAASTALPLLLQQLITSNLGLALGRIHSGKLSSQCSPAGASECAWLGLGWAVADVVPLVDTLCFQLNQQLDLGRSGLQVLLCLQLGSAQAV
jgi:hypothetical protein